MTKTSKFHSRQEQQDIIYPEESTSSLEPDKPPTKWVKVIAL